jgi:hypothetical protein
MYARTFGALSATFGAVAVAIGVFCVGVGAGPLEGAALAPVKTTGVPPAPVSPSTLVTSTTTTVPVTPASSPYVPLYPGVADAVELALNVSVSGLSITDVESTCFDTAVATAAVTDPDVGAAVDALTADATTWWQTDRAVRQRFTSAYVGCTDYDQLLFFLAIATMNTLDAAPCVAAGWSAVLTPALLASSLAYGTGLDDLPPATVGPLVDATLRCMSGGDWTDWWIDDVALELDGVTGIPPSATECLARNYVRELGVERVIERRVLTLPVLTLNALDLAAIDPSGCGAQLATPEFALGQLGDCLADVFRTAVWPVVACTGPHNGEILAVTDLTGVVPEWPGWSAMNDRGRSVCTAAADAAQATAESAADRAFTLWWFPPTRAAWEAGGRLITCVVGPFDDGDWMAPSGLVPTPNGSKG